jgi:hypothetical protein
LKGKDEEKIGVERKIRDKTGDCEFMKRGKTTTYIRARYFTGTRVTKRETSKETNQSNVAVSHVS